MIAGALLLSVAALCTGCGDNKSTDPGAPITVPDDVRGLWQVTDGSRACHAIDVDSSGAYVAVTMKFIDCPCCPGERCWEFRWDPGIERFRGRHIWGGCGYDTTWWSEEGTLEIKLRSPDELYVWYLDSVVYPHGWRLTRVESCEASDFDYIAPDPPVLEPNDPILAEGHGIRRRTKP